MNDHEMQLDPAPSTMPQDAFVARFGTLYEHSAWIARRAWQRGLTRQQDTVAGLAQALAAEVEAADEQARLDLIRAHPDLGGRAAVAGELTVDSKNEQAGAGLDACTPEQFERLQQLNTAYRDKFGFPFVVAVKDMRRQDILAAMAGRLDNDRATEQHRALTEIHKIARLRLRALP